MAHISTEEIHKELDLIQGCINRMAQNSFMIKGWLIAIYTVVLALVPETVAVPWLLGLVMVTVTIMLWYLDAFFLQAERNYRNVYSWVLEVRPEGNRELLYELNTHKYQKKELIKKSDGILTVMWSKTLRWFYGIPLLISLVFMIVQLFA